MTVITYSGAAGSPAKGIPVRQRLSVTRNVAEPLSKILGPWAMSDPSEYPGLEVCGVKGRTRIEERGSKREGDEDRETWGRVFRRIKRERKEEECNGRSLSCREVGKGRVSCRRRLECEADTPETLTAAETKGAIKQTEENSSESTKRPFSPVSFLRKKTSEEGVKTGRKTTDRMQRVRVWLFVRLTLLLFFGLCPNVASSQVRMPHKIQVCISFPKTPLNR